jgi:hypothetical protein
MVDVELGIRKMNEGKVVVEEEKKRKRGKGQERPLSIAAVPTLALVPNNIR